MKISQTKAKVLSGKDQMNLITPTHLFGVKMELLQKLPSKVILVIAGSFHQLQLLHLSQKEFIVSSGMKIIQSMVPLECGSKSEVNGSLLPLMIDFLLLIGVKVTILNINCSTLAFLHREPGG